MEPIPPDAFLAGFPDAIRGVAERLRAVILRAVPDAVEAVRPGWRLIGYDVPVGRRRAYFGYVAPEAEHVHLGFEHGVLLDDPEGLLEGAQHGLRKVRYVTYRPGDEIPHDALAGLVREAARIAAASPAERMAIAMDREADAPRRGGAGSD